MSDIGTQTADEIRSQVQKDYARVARQGGAASCCSALATDKKEYARGIGYTDEDLDKTPDGANLAVGCGNPTAMAALEPGQVVVDLGSGAGFDAFLAAHRVGPTGRVIGVDMTPEMVERARANAAKAGFGQVEFRQGLIEALPVDSESVDVVLSNCVINLSPDKPKVFREAYRVLKPGGKLAVSDILLTEPLPRLALHVAALYSACVSGASVAEDYFAELRAAGFTEIRHTRVPARPVFEPYLEQTSVRMLLAVIGKERTERILGNIWSYKIEAVKAA